jgi:hypothetical protein
MSNTELQKIPAQDLVRRTNQQIAITNKILALSNTNKIIAFALRHPDFFCEMTSYHYPLPETLIKKYKDKWEWDSLSQRSSLPWSIELIEKFKDKWE